MIRIFKSEDKRHEIILNVNIRVLPLLITTSMIHFVMKITFGCIIIYKEKILLAREKSNKSKQLEKWNFPSGTGEKNEFIFKEAIHREMMEEVGLDVKLKGLVAIYESNTPKDTSYYFVVGCKVSSDKIKISDPDILEAKFFPLKEFFAMKEGEIVHTDMWHVVSKFLDGVYIDTLRTVIYT